VIFENLKNEVILPEALATIALSNSAGSMPILERFGVKY